MKKRTVVALVFAVFLVASAYAQTPFYQLVQHGTPQDVQAAISQGAAVNALHNGLSPLMEAVMANPNPDVITVLVKAGADIKAKDDKSGSTPLILAIRYGQYPGMINTLLKLGADINGRDSKNGRTPLMWALHSNRGPEVITTLLKAGADIKAKDNNGMTALMFGAQNNHNLEVIMTLLQAGADIKAKDNNGMAALLFAVQNNNIPGVITALLKAGADIKAKDNNGMTALLFGALNNHIPEVITALLEAGADLKAKDNNGMTPLMLAAQYNRKPEVITTLLKAGADLEGQTYNGSTSLMLAAQYNQNPEVVTALLKAGADIKAKDNNGMTSLMLAARYSQNPEVVTTLLKAGANEYAIDTAGRTAVDYAQDNEKLKGTDVYRQLQEKPLASLELRELTLQDIYPVFHTYYDTHSLGKVVLINTTKQPITGIKVSFQIKEFMADPKDCPAPAELGPGESKSVDLFCLFLPTILQTTEKTKTQARVDVEYTLGGQVEHQKLVQSISILNRNATSWTDDKRAAAFVTVRDPAVLTFSRNVNSVAKGIIKGEVNPSLLTAVALFQALQLYGLTYSQDPIPTLTSDRQVADFIQFPRETLQYKGGKCSDFSVLYSALLESVGIETAFVTIPGHIFIAFSTGVNPDQAKKIFSSRADDLIFNSDKSWIPVEVTETAGFLQAWQDGAKEWRENTASNQAAFYPLHDAWQLYEPVALPGTEVAVNLPPSATIVSASKKEVGKFIDKEISTKVAALESEITTGQDPRKPTNELGVLYARYGQYDRAQKEFEKLLAKEEYIPALLNMGNILYLNNQKEKALVYYNRAYAKDPENPRVLLQVTRVNQELENYGTVEKLYAELKARDPDLAQRFAYLDLKGEEATRAANIAGANGVVVWEE